MKTILVLLLGIGFIAGMIIIAKKNTGKTAWQEVPKEERKKTIIKGIKWAIICVLIMIAVAAAGFYLNPMSYESIWNSF